MEVLLGNDDFRLVVGNALDFIGPLAAELDRCFNRFCSRVHRKHFVKPKVLGDVLFVATEYAVVKCTRGQAKLVGLFFQSTYNARMAMPLVYG